MIDSDYVVHRDQDIIQGTWKTVSIEVNARPFEDGTDRKLIISRREITFVTSRKNKPDEVGVQTYRIDADKYPKTIDMVATIRDRKLTLRGIYRIENDTLTLCYDGSAEKERPTEFATKINSSYVLSVYKRDNRTSVRR